MTIPYYFSPCNPSNCYPTVCLLWKKSRAFNHMAMLPPSGISCLDNSCPASIHLPGHSQPYLKLLRGLSLTSEHQPSVTPWPVVTWLYGPSKATLMVIMSPGLPCSFTHIVFQPCQTCFGPSASTPNLHRWPAEFSPNSPAYL